MGTQLLNLEILENKVPNPADLQFNLRLLEHGLW